MGMLCPGEWGKENRDKKKMEVNMEIREAAIRNHRMLSLEFIFLICGLFISLSLISFYLVDFLNCQSFISVLVFVDLCNKKYKYFYIHDDVIWLDSR